MIKFQVDDRVYKVPESWDEISFEDYCRIFRGIDTKSVDDEVEDFKRIRVNESIILSRLLGEDDEFCLGLPLNAYALLNESVKFIYDVDFLLRNAKAGIVVDGHRYSIPPFNEMSLRQYIDADVVMQDDDNPLQYIELLSVLLTERGKDGKWKPYTGEYQELMGKLRKLSCSEALPLVYHFFKLRLACKKLSGVSMKVEGVSR